MKTVNVKNEVYDFGALVLIDLDPITLMIHELALFSTYLKCNTNLRRTLLLLDRYSFPYVHIYNTNTVI